MEIYAKAFHRIHGSTLGKSESDILGAIKEGDAKVSNKAKKILESAKCGYELDKRTIADEMVRIISAQEKLDEVTKNTFKELFENIAKRIALR